MAWPLALCWTVAIFALLVSAALVGLLTARLFLSATDARSDTTASEVRDAHPVRH